MTVHYSCLRRCRRITPCLSTFAALSSENCLYRVQGGGNFSREVCHVPPEFKIHFYANLFENLLSPENLFQQERSSAIVLLSIPPHGNRGKKPIKLYNNVIVCGSNFTCHKTEQLCIRVSRKVSEPGISYQNYLT